MQDDTATTRRRHLHGRPIRLLVTAAFAAACVTTLGVSTSGALPARIGAAQHHAAKPKPKKKPKIGLVKIKNPTAPVPLKVNKSINCTVYALWPNTTTPAWPLYTIPTEVAAFKKWLPNVKLVQMVGNNDQATQLTQVEAAITSKACAVVYSPVVPTQAGGALQAFHQAKIPTIALRQDPDGGPVNSYVWVDFKSVGQYWGKFIRDNLVKNVGHTPVRVAEIIGDPTFEVYNRWNQGINPYLQPLINSGQVQIVCKQDTPGFNPTSAQNEMDACLTQTGGNIDAAIIMQDSTGDGIAASLASHHLLGKVQLYGGHDADVQTLQRILLGQQFGTFHPDGHYTANATVALVEAALEHKSPRSTGYINGTFLNGYYPAGVPTVLAHEQLVTAQNMQQTIIDDGFLPKTSICTGPAASTSFCTG
jgi:D-xylose transport system substrate-binding protein